MRFSSLFQAEIKRDLQCSKRAGREFKGPVGPLNVTSVHVRGCKTVNSESPQARTLTLKTDSSVLSFRWRGLAGRGKMRGIYDILNRFTAPWCDSRLIFPPVKLLTLL